MLKIFVSNIRQSAFIQLLDKNGLEVFIY